MAHLKMSIKKVHTGKPSAERIFSVFAFPTTDLHTSGCYRNFPCFSKLSWNRVEPAYPNKERRLLLTLLNCALKACFQFYSITSFSASGVHLTISHKSSVKIGSLVENHSSDFTTDHWDGIYVFIS